MDGGHSNDMNSGCRIRNKRTGYVLILVGILLPTFLLLRTTGYDPAAGPIDKILKLKIVVKKGASRHSSDVQDQSTAARAQEKDLTIPYRFPLALSILLLFFGILAVDQARTAPTKEE
jgi:hypothetical protein